MSELHAHFSFDRIITLRYFYVDNVIAHYVYVSYIDHGVTWKKAGTLYGIPYGSQKLSGDFIPDEPQVQCSNINSGVKHVASYCISSITLWYQCF